MSAPIAYSKESVAHASDETDGATAYRYPRRLSDGDLSESLQALTGHGSALESRRVAV